jgi:acyl dehydratase
MPINPDAVGTRSQPERRRWSSKDSLIYALGVGAGAQDPLAELEFTTENSQDVTQRALPTMPVVLGAGVAGAYASIGSFNPAMLVHGEQSVALARELPVEGELEAVTEVVGVYDKGSGALVVTETTASLVDDGQPLFTTRSGAFIRGEGGFGGDRGPSSTFAAPERAPDHEVAYPTRTDQALLYRLSGDRNPLHSDPKFAAMAGFDRPILHGLCSFGIACKAVVDAALDGDTTKVARYQTRFAGIVYPGETIVTSMWKEEDKILIRAVTKERGDPVLTNAAITIR